MEWTPIDRNNLPEGVVLAARFEENIPEPTGIGYGYLRDEEEMGIYCYVLQCSSYAVENVTHFFDPKTLKKVSKQNDVLN